MDILWIWEGRKSSLVGVLKTILTRNYKRLVKEGINGYIKYRNWGIKFHIGYSLPTTNKIHSTNKNRSCTLNFQGYHI